MQSGLPRILSNLASRVKRACMSHQHSLLTCSLTAAAAAAAAALFVPQSGLSRIRSNLASRVKKARMSQAAADAAMAKVTGTLDYNSFGGCCRRLLCCSGFD
jgi:hypothetical protein